MLQENEMSKIKSTDDLELVRLLKFQSIIHDMKKTADRHNENDIFLLARYIENFSITDLHTLAQQSANSIEMIIAIHQSLSGINPLMQSLSMLSLPGLNLLLSRLNLTFDNLKLMTHQNLSSFLQKESKTSLSELLMKVKIKTLISVFLKPKTTNEETPQPMIVNSNAIMKPKAIVANISLFANAITSTSKNAMLTNKAGKKISKRKHDSQEFDKDDSHFNKKRKT